MRDIGKIIIRALGDKPMDENEAMGDLLLAFRAAKEHGESMGMSEKHKNTIVVHRLDEKGKNGNIIAVWCTRGGMHKCVLYEKKEE